MVASRAKKFVVIVDESKIADQGLGTSFCLPVEVTPFAWKATLKTITALPSVAGCVPRLRVGTSAKPAKRTPEPGEEKMAPATTDNGNYVIDLFFDAPLKDPTAAAAELKGVIGVVDHGLFCGMTSEVIVAARDGVYKRNE